MRRRGGRSGSGMAGHRRRATWWTRGWRRCSARVFTPLFAVIAVALLIGVVGHGHHGHRAGSADPLRRAPGRVLALLLYAISGARPDPRPGFSIRSSSCSSGPPWRWTCRAALTWPALTEYGFSAQQDGVTGLKSDPSWSTRPARRGCRPVPEIAVRFRGRRAMADALRARICDLGGDRRCRLPAAVRLRVTSRQSTGPPKRGLWSLPTIAALTPSVHWGIDSKLMVLPMQTRCQHRRSRKATAKPAGRWLRRLLLSATASLGGATPSLGSRVHIGTYRGAPTHPIRVRVDRA